MDPLRALEEKYRTLLECLPNSVLTVDREGRILSLNRTSSGRPPSEVLGRTVFEFTVEEDRPKLADALARVFRGETVTVHARGIGIGGGTTWWSSRLGPIRDGDAVEAALWVAQDITELQVTSDRFRELAENVHEVFYQALPDYSRFLYVSPAYERIWGRSVESLYASPMSWIEAVPPEDRARIEALLAESMGRGEPYSAEYRVVRPDGGVRWVWDRAVEIRGPDGRSVRVVGVIEDITERVEREARHRQILEQASDGILIADREGRFLDSNPAGCAMLGYSKEELVRRTIADVTDPADLEREPLRFPELLAGRTVVNERVLLRKDGTTFSAEISAKLLPDGIVLGVVRDITERRKAEERFRLVARATNEIIWDVDLVTGRVWRNEAMRNLGYEPADCEPTLEWTVERIHPDDRDRVRRIIEDATTQGRTGWSAEYRLRRKDGSYALILDRGFIGRGADGRPVRMTGAALDISERLAAEERFRRAFTDSGIGMAIVLPDGTFLQANPALCAMLGYAATEIVGRTFSSITHPDDQNSSLDLARRMLAGELGSAQLEKRYLAKDGRVVWIILSTSLMRDPEGRPLYFVSQFQDITRRRQAEEALRQSEERFQLVARATNDAIWDWDLGTDSVWWNEAVGSLFLYHPEEIGRDLAWWKDRIHPDDRDRVTAGIEEALRQGRSGWQDEYRFRRGDGSSASVFDRGFITRAPDGQALRMIGSMMDITDLKEAEEALRRQTHLYETILKAQSNVGEGFILAEGERILFVNDAFCRLSGYAPEELYAMPSYLAYIPPDQQALVEDRRKRREAGLPVEDRYETAILHKSGRRIEIEVAVKTFEEDGRKKRVVISRDITSRKRAHEELERRVEERTRELRDAMERILREQETLTESTLRALRTEHLQEALRVITETGARALGVERVSVWRYAPDRSEIRCVDLFELTKGTHSLGAVLPAAPFPAYFRAIEEKKVIAADDALRDPRTREFAEGYLAPLGITSMMDASIHLRGEVDGVLCHEHIGPARAWTPDEQTFAVALANLVSLALEQAQRHAAEESLRQSEERFRQLAENIEEVFWVSRADNHQNLYVSPAFERIWGRTIAEMSKNPMAWIEAVHPDDRDRVRGSLPRQALGNWEIEYRIVRPDGAIRWIRDRAFPIRDARGEIFRFAGIAEDVTQRKSADDALRKLAEEQGLLLGHTRDFVYRHDTKGVFTYLSPAVEQVTGHSINDWLQHYTTYMTDSPINKKVIAYTEETLRTGRQSPPYVVEVRHRDGRPILLEVNERAYFEGDRIAGVIGVARDVTERERAQEALRESERKYAELIRESPDAIILLDLEGRYLAINPAAERIIGLPADQILGRRFRDLGILPKGSLERSQDEFSRIVSGEERRPFEIDIESRSGKWILEANPRRLPRGVQVTFRDVTARKAAEEEVRRAADATRRAYDALKRTQHMLIQAEKLASVGMVMAGIAHEINNPLNVIYGNLRLLEGQCQAGAAARDNRKIRQMLRDAITASENARRVVEEFRHFARDTGVAEPVALRPCVEEAIEGVRPFLGRRVKVARAFRPVPAIRAFRGQIRRAVQNILKNAVESIEGKGTVRIALRRSGEHAVIEVADTGRGIPKDQLPRVFEPFFTTKEHGRGFGLGLALCAAVVQNHGGRISVKSTVGKGTTFTIRLPIKP